MVCYARERLRFGPSEDLQGVPLVTFQYENTTGPWTRLRSSTTILGAATPKYVGPLRENIADRTARCGSCSQSREVYGPISGLKDIAPALSELVPRLEKLVVEV